MSKGVKSSSKARSGSSNVCRSRSHDTFGTTFPKILEDFCRYQRARSGRQLFTEEVVGILDNGKWKMENDRSCHHRCLVYSIYL